MIIDVVVPTLGRPSLAAMLTALADARGPLPRRVLLVDDRRAPAPPMLPDGAPPSLVTRLEVLRARAAGPAAARNVGWRASDADWIAFLDDDVVPERDWLANLQADLDAADAGVGATQGRIVVPLPPDRRPTDWERNVRGLERARWATADMAYRRAALASVHGFDERFPRAYREDADLALRVTSAGWRLVAGRRSVQHPVRAADRWVSVRLQAGNADDALMRRLHGRNWRRRAGVPEGRRPRHLVIVAVGVAALAAAALGRRRAAKVAAVTWVAATAEFAWARIAPGPRTPNEIATLLATSIVIPPVATWHWLRGVLRTVPRVEPWNTAAPDSCAQSLGVEASRGAEPSQSARPRRTARAAGSGWRASASGPIGATPDAEPSAAMARPVRAVLLDRDGTLVVDVPYNGDPDRVMPMPGARDAVSRLRAAGVKLAVVSNQSGIGRGLLTADQVDAVNQRVEALLGPLGPWLLCPHAPDVGCECRKPAPGLVLRAAAALGVRPDECAVIGDTAADVDAARAAGARGVLVPNAVTLRAEVVAAAEVAPDLATAVTRLLGAA
jgi:histidinol-phosphate phosphatase family protein